jgi:hypothetical protein
LVHFYKDDKPYPGYLIFAYIDKRSSHVLVAVDNDSGECIIITAYEPSLDIWEEDFKTKKP